MGVHLIHTKIWITNEFNFGPSRVAASRLRHLRRLERHRHRLHQVSSKAITAAAWGCGAAASTVTSTSSGTAWSSGPAAGAYCASSLSAAAASSSAPLKSRNRHATTSPWEAVTRRRAREASRPGKQSRWEHVYYMCILNRCEMHKTSTTKTIKSWKYENRLDYGNQNNQNTKRENQQCRRRLNC